MSFSLRNWRPAHVMAAWVAWWCGVVAVSMGDVVVAGIRAGIEGGSITGGIGDDGLGITAVTKAGETVAMHALISTLMLTMIVPPLALWAAWLVQRPRREKAGDTASLPAGWPAGDAAPQRVVTPTGSPARHDTP